MLILFTVAIFVGSALLFLVQPMIAKMLLPKLGGSPAVWNTCMVFFQAALLGGYLYAHLINTKLRSRQGAPIHMLAVLVPLGLLLFGHGMMPRSNPPEGNPIAWLLMVLSVGIGLPFLIVSTGGPMIQRWFSQTGHPSAKDPYFLYAASNAGSLIALLGYPLAVEPFISLAGQRTTWIAGYGLFALLTVSAGAALLASKGKSRAEEVVDKALPVAALSWKKRLWWVALAFVPSSLLLGVTQYISTDLAAVPLLWIIPLSIYLLSFIFAFAKTNILPVRVASYAIVFLALAGAVTFLAEATSPILLIVAIHLALFFVSCMLGHGRLAEERPPASQLTEFYLMMSIGGVLGGIFNALLAPIAFNAMIEYPLAIAAACMLRQRATRQEAPAAASLRRRLDFALPIALVVVILTVDQLVRLAGRSEGFANFLSRYDSKETWLNTVPFFTVGIPGVMCFTFIRHPTRFALGIAVLMAAALFLHPGPSARELETRRGMVTKVLFSDRTFYGQHTVLTGEPAAKWIPDPGDRGNMLFHGNTLHGLQSYNVKDPQASLRLKRDPLTYYHRSGPLGKLFSVFGGTPKFSDIGIIGLGAGSTAAYVGAGQRLTYYDIDPAVVRIAEDPSLFTYLTDARARGAQIPPVTLGDGRIKIAQAPDQAYGLIILDAFSSDAIPIHLITKEAMEIYLAKLKPGGIIAFHISNRYLDLEPVLASIAASLNLVVYACHDVATLEQAGAGKSDSRWVILARQQSDLGPFPTTPNWRNIITKAESRPWTDDYSNILGAFTLGEMPD